MSVSLDGFVTGADGKVDWRAPEDPAVDHGDQRHRLNLEMLSQLDVILLGRGGLRGNGALAWASSNSPMAQLMNALPKIVFSESLTELDWNNVASQTSSPWGEEIEQFKREPGRDIVAFGGGHFAHSLIRERLVDE